MAAPAQTGGRRQSGIRRFTAYRSRRDSTPARARPEVAGNTTLARPTPTPAATDASSIRSGNCAWPALHAPEFYGLRARAVSRWTFSATRPPTPPELVTATAGLFAAPAPQLAQLETPFVDILIGQSWQLFGWQPYFHAGAVSISGIPGDIFSRAAQIRLSHSFRTNPVNVDVAVSLARRRSATRWIPTARLASG